MTVELLRSFFCWTAVCKIVFLSVIFFIFLITRNVIHLLHGRWFGISKETINAILYGAMAGYKLAIFAFFVMPYLALRFFM
ncbi:MAG: hypothetical protein LBV45_07100 [Xanthomonadaceae bacterium]|jgi:hypothetical protein|nr:hypothetical protein [Xanthomonadaceae bacterium]